MAVFGCPEGACRFNDTLAAFRSADPTLAAFRSADPAKVLEAPGAKV
jgi:hypothetical protein